MPNDRPLFVQTQRTNTKQRREPADPRSLERGVRQLLADKVSGTMVGLWLLIPEHLRLGTWDLLRAWTGKSAASLEPRLALQAVHECALCLPRARRNNSLSQKGFEVANGLPFVATDQSMHALFEARTVERTRQLQMALGRLRRASGHFKGRLLAVDSHHMRSYTKRQMRRHRHAQNEKAIKTTQAFFCLDAQTRQPVAFTLGSAAKTASQAIAELLPMAEAILNPEPRQALVMVDSEYWTRDVFEYINRESNFDLICPMPRSQTELAKLAALPPGAFTPRWPGLATARLPHQLNGSDTQPLYKLVQRCGERPEDYRYSSFLSTCERDELDQLIKDYPDRWHIEEFFNTHQAMGWKHAATLNLNIRYAQATTALIAQAAVHQLRQRLGPPHADWEAGHLGRHLFQGIDGDLRVIDDTILVTLYNAPNAERLREHYENLPRKLERENINPTIPWLYGFKLDFRFK